MIITTPQISDIPSIARIHSETFKDFFLTTLGEKFLRTYYRSYFKCNESVLLVVKDTDINELIGFAAGTAHSEGFHKRLIKKNLIDFFVTGVLIIFSRPSALIRIMKNLDKKTDVADDGNYAELLSIAILPQYAGKGIGKKILEEFEKNVKSKGGSRLALTTDFENNDSTLRFYKGCGYSVFNEFVAFPNRLMYKLIKEL